MNLSKTLRSPDGRHAARFNYAGEIRFGPTYYSVELDGRSLRRFLFWQRHFGDACLWSSDSRYIALSEWRRVSEKGGPDTQLIVIDIDDQRECAPDRARGGFVAPVGFTRNALSYTKTFYSAERVPEVRRSEVDLLTSPDWHPVWRWWNRLA